MGWKIFSFEYFLSQYRACGFRVIPIEGKTLSDGTFDEKAAGYENWENYIATDKQLLTHIEYRQRWSAVCGLASRGLLVLDYDLEDEFGSVENARKWRALHTWALRDMDTVVDFTPSGGCHVWFYAPNGLPEPGRISRITYGAFPCEPDLIKYSGQVLIPPSRLTVKGYYRFMDQDEVLPELPQRIRTIK